MTNQTDLSDEISELNDIMDQDGNELIDEDNNALIIKSANDWNIEAQSEPDSKELFGQLWFEGEIVVLFGDTGLGKSALAVQIGDGIARAESYIKSLPVQSDSQDVLYIDAELSKKQFQKRYTLKETGQLYSFHLNFKRAEISKEKILEADSSFESIYESIKNAIEKYGIKIFILDNFSFISEDAEKSKEVKEILKKLKCLINEHKASLMLLAHTPKIYSISPITLNDLAGSKALSNFSDSVFAIGKSYKEMNEASTVTQARYIKQLKVRSAEERYFKQVIILNLEQFSDGFFGFRYIGEDDEFRHLEKRTPEKDKDTVSRLKDGENLSIREIASRTGISKSKVQTLLKEAEDHRKAKDVQVVINAPLPSIKKALSDDKDGGVFDETTEGEE